MSDLPWFKLGADDWLANEAVRLLNLTERGALIDLMVYVWFRGSIPDDEGQLARLLGVKPATFHKVWPGVRELFVEHPTENGRLVHAELEQQRERAEAKRRRFSESGRRGAEKRWGAVTEVADGMKPASDKNRGHLKGQAIARPSPGDSKEKEKKNKKENAVEAAPSHLPQEGRAARLNEKTGDVEFDRRIEQMAQGFRDDNGRGS